MTPDEFDSMDYQVTGDEVRVFRGDWERLRQAVVDHHPRKRDALSNPSQEYWTDAEDADEIIQKQQCEVCGAVLADACPNTHRPPYTTDIASAWSLLEEIGGLLDIRRRGPEEWYVHVHGAESEMWAEAAPLAICRAVAAVVRRQSWLTQAREQFADHEGSPAQ
jgi:hypothetical protein